MRVSARNCLKSLDRAKTEPYEQTKRAEEAPILACCANECALETPSELLFRQFPMNVLGNPESMRRAGALRPRSVLAGSYLSSARHRVAQRVVLRPFQPLRVVLNPRVVAFRRNAELHQVALGAHSEHTHLPILCLLMAMLTVCQLSKLLASLGADDGLECVLEGLSRMGDHRLRLPREDFFGHLGHGLFGSHGALLLSRLAVGRASFHLCSSSKPAVTSL